MSEIVERHLTGQREPEHTVRALYANGNPWLRDINAERVANAFLRDATIARMRFVLGHTQGIESYRTMNPKTDPLAQIRDRLETIPWIQALPWERGTQGGVEMSLDAGKLRSGAAFADALSRLGRMEAGRGSFAESYSETDRRDHEAMYIERLLIARRQNRGAYSESHRMIAMGCTAELALRHLIRATLERFTVWDEIEPAVRLLQEPHWRESKTHAINHQYTWNFSSPNNVTFRRHRKRYAEFDAVVMPMNGKNMLLFDCCTDRDQAHEKITRETDKDFSILRRECAESGLQLEKIHVIFQHSDHYREPRLTEGSHLVTLPGWLDQIGKVTDQFLASLPSEQKRRSA